MMARHLRLKNNVAAFFIDAAIGVMLAEQLNQLRATEIARQLHSQANTSSRTKCNRTRVGLG
jgi:hypothetical protein